MFKRNSPELKTLTINILVAFVIAVFFALGDTALDSIGFYFGLSALGIGLIDIPIAVVVFIAGSNTYGKAFLISAGLLLLLSGISCGSSAFFE